VLPRTGRSASSRLALSLFQHEHHCHALKDCPAAERYLLGSLHPPFMWHPSMWALALFAGLIVGQLLPAYFRKKGEHLATKEDLGALTRIAEDIKTEHQLLLERTRPFTAEETLRRESFFRSKLEAFYSALDVVYRVYASNELTITDRGETLKPATKTRPSEAEINLAYGRMAMFAGSRSVLDKYQQFHSTPPQPGDIGDLVGFMRADLGFGETLVPGATYPYVIGVERKTPGPAA
jgi:hypothetical protein